MSISIHAPRVGSDEEESTAEDVVTLFQSTLPVWGATGTQLDKAAKSQFQSTLPVWGATSSDAGQWPQESRISIHAPRVGSDHPVTAISLYV